MKYVLRSSCIYQFTALSAQHAIFCGSGLESRASTETTAERTYLCIPVATYACASNVEKLTTRTAEELCVWAQRDNYLCAVRERTCCVVCGTHRNADLLNTCEKRRHSDLAFRISS